MDGVTVGAHVLEHRGPLGGDKTGGEIGKRRVDRGEQTGPRFGRFGRGEQHQRRDARPSGLGSPHGLGAMLAPSLHGHLVPGAPQDGIVDPGLHGGYYGPGGVLAEATEQLGRSPRLDEGELLGEALGVARCGEGLSGQDPRHLVVAMSVRGGA